MRLEPLRNMNECSGQFVPPIWARFFGLEVAVRLLHGFKQLFGGLDDHELFKRLHLGLQGMRP